MPDVLPEELVAYLAKRDAQRANDVNAVLNALTTRERALLREAAVMAYVRGRMYPQDADHPKDSAVVAEVISCCLANSDLYKTISRIADITADKHEKAEFLTQTQQPDGSWEFSSAPTEILEAATSLLESLRRRMPDFQHRMVQRHTTVAVYVVPEPDDDTADEEG